MHNEQIKQQYQPLGSTICGQTCVAMVLGISIGEARRQVGKWGRTRAKDLAAALAKNGCGTRIVPSLRGKARVPRDEIMSDRLPDRCILRVKRVGARFSHCVLRWDGRIYDPWPGGAKWTHAVGFVEILEAG
jgi:hypothetical protein